MIGSVAYLNSTSSLEFKMRSTLSANLSQTNNGEEVEFNSRLNGVKDAITGDKLSDEEKDYVEKLKKRDAEVRQHEQAHKSAAGDLASGSPNYEYKIGPDGRRYIVGGNVQIDTSAIPNNPEETIKKAQKIKKAALAPSDPSPKDRQVASAATRMEQQARLEQLKGGNADSSDTPDNEAVSSPNMEEILKNLEKNVLSVYDINGNVGKYEVDAEIVNIVV